jgi:hypothetical protein
LPDSDGAPIPPCYPAANFVHFRIQGRMVMPEPALRRQRQKHRPQAFERRGGLFG